jgi:hypothetical protein
MVTTKGQQNAIEIASIWWTETPPLSELFTRWTGSSARVGVPLTVI